MMTSLTVALGLLAVTGSPTYAEPEEVSNEIESYSPESYEMDSYGDSEYQGCDSCDSCGHAMGCWNYHMLKWRSPWNLSQHLPYYPAAHGYYYFRPYNHVSVRVHAEIVRKWGGDPRNPYSNKLFERVYNEVEAEDMGGPFRDDIPEELNPATDDASPRSTESKPRLFFPDETAARSVRHSVRPAHFESGATKASGRLSLKDRKTPLSLQFVQP